VDEVVRHARSAAVWLASGLAVALVVTACTPGGTGSAEVRRPPLCDAPFPEVRADDATLHEVLDAVVDAGYQGQAAYARAARLGDVRVVPVLLDVLRVLQFQPEGDRLTRELARLTGCDLGVEWVPWQRWALARDVPAPPRYQEYKRRLLALVHTDYDRFLTGPVDLDLREVAWGGVAVDEIVPLVDPPAVPATEASELPDDTTVFGLVVDGAARAYPRALLVEHEMVDDVLGEVPITMPYCTLCGTATGYVAETGGRRLVMGTSGLLDRSNKLMYDRETGSLWRSYDGTAVSGPLRRTTLSPLPVTVTSWGEWRAAHPVTTVVVPDSALEDQEPDVGSGDPLFPVPPVDPRLPALTEVLGIDDGDRAIAVPLDEARRQAPFTLDGIRVQLEGGDLVAVAADGRPLPVRRSFWFAWS
jgi:hypothetical protein